MKNLKNVLLPLIFLVLTLGLVSTAYAAASFTVNDLEFGSDSQVRGEDVTQTLTIHNDGSEALTISLVSKMPTVYDTQIVPSTITINPNASTDVEVTITVPDTTSSKKVEVKSGILLTATNVVGLSKTAKTYVQAESKLEISKVSIFVDDGSEKTLKAGDTFDTGLKAGTPIVIRVYARNNYNDNEDIDIQDIEATIEGDGDLDLDDTDSIDDLRSGDKDYTEFSTEIPSDADDGDNYDIDVTVEGQDDNGAWHYDTFSTELEVSKESHEVTIEDARISPSTVSCSGKITITADLHNTGKYDEDRVFLLIENDDLDIMEKFYSMALDEDDTATKTYSFNVDSKTAPGSYDFMLTSFYGSDKQSDAQVLTLTVAPCQSTTPTTPTTPTTSTGTNTNTNTNTQPTMPQVIPITGATPAYGTASFTDSPAYLVILVAAVIVILLILIILLVKFVF